MSTFGIKEKLTRHTEGQEKKQVRTVGSQGQDKVPGIEGEAQKLSNRVQQSQFFFSWFLSAVSAIEISKGEFRTLFRLEYSHQFGVRM